MAAASSILERLGIFKCSKIEIYKLILLIGTRVTFVAFDFFYILID